MSEVLTALAADRVLPVVVVSDVDRAEPLADALLAGGLHCAEVTFRTEAAQAAIRVLAARSELLVGAGTVLTVEQVDRAVDAGARFVVSPGYGPAVVRRCQERGVPVYPGVATATEVQMALDAGLDTVKFFPAEQLGGAGMVKALAAPFRSVRFIPTGGVTATNLAGYLAVPAVLAVGASWMVAAELLAAGDWAEVTRRCQAVVEVARVGASVGGGR
ncbi:MAG: bifunctional 4-hydroxy-2-oxoglutarate aldolase/2-dehydro-3-deoxy-phosphogluconate aldolase [Micromonosporaceae bacterium]|nr:bifunctional 4-hydroxy-2-oxoglutarate aldolase/2-dehydro-3-deoxy-phosphogluconate aldolase [Micromonosporaceae bacterium]